MDVFVAKQKLRGMVAHGDLAKAARLVGYKTPHAMYLWINAKVLYPKCDARNIRVLAEVVKEREAGVADSIAKVMELSE